MVGAAGSSMGRRSRFPLFRSLGWGSLWVIVPTSIAIWASILALNLQVVGFRDRTVLLAWVFAYHLFLALPVVFAVAVLFLRPGRSDAKPATVKG